MGVPDERMQSGTMAPEEQIAPGVRRPPHLLWAMAIGALAVLLVLLLGTTLGTARSFAFERAITAALRQVGNPAAPTGPGWLRPMMIDLTAMGGTTVLTLASIGAVVLLLTRRLWLTAALVAAATLSGSVAVVLLKRVVARARPDLAGRLVEVDGHSFPSGHAANSAIVYLTIALLASQVVHGRATRNVLLGGAVLLVGAIGTSRVYLGVHWPADVLAGWCLGTLWALGWWLAGARLRSAR
ncbi:undecaprenyl-diphosphatase [Sphingomonas guangdongensis]|uniref:Undecaprenyl-diphosphatase n=1 Tax=Sphingomonas guangdongensis TaxID=1141890 RepID=A0A285QYW8_9SPHN|nr:phosphatase PAP2 family protein [Sphingomonas guangdongensis]SOB86658.1 undecaprenyl-diphosphatase [Sphingomonas guangdongensis]